MIDNTPRQSVILVVDDVPANIDVVRGALEPEYRVRTATNGNIALKAANISPYPDLILLDIMMPGMDGYAVCQKLKADAVTSHIPIIFVTAKSEESDELKGLLLGAVDYIAKPFSIPIVQARVKTQLALSTATQKLDLQNRHLLLERELIESIILKMRAADIFDERNLRNLVSPVEETAGDMLLSTFAPDGRQLVLLGDFTGHGLTAAIGGPLVAYILYELSRRGLAGHEIISEINRQLCARLPTGIFFAATLIEIAPNRKKASLWNSALPDTLLLRNGAIHERFLSNLVPLGISSELDMAAATQTIALEAGDRLYTFSDGIIEAKGRDGEMFAMERLEIFLIKASLDAGVDLNDLLIVLENYTGSSIFDDDITLVEVMI